MTSWPPPEPSSVPRRGSPPSVRTVALVGGVLALIVAVLRICYPLARHRRPCELVDPRYGAVRDAACGATQRFHNVIDPWFVIVGAGLGTLAVVVLLLVPVISRRLDGHFSASDPPEPTS